MSSMASQITSLAIVYSTVYSRADQRKHQSSVSQAFVWGIHRWPVNFPHKGPVTRKMFPFDDVIIRYKIHFDVVCSVRVKIKGIWWQNEIPFQVHARRRWTIHIISQPGIYRKISIVSHTRSQNLNASILVLQSPLPNSLKPGVTSTMKM